MGVLNSLANNAAKFTQVTAAFKEINTLVSTSSAEWEKTQKAIENIANTDFSNLKNIRELKDILSKPLRVQLDTNGATLQADVSLEIDGVKLMDSMPIVSYLKNKGYELSEGKISENASRVR